MNINKDENKSLTSNQFSLENDPPPHFLENYFAEVKIKNDHMIDKMEDRVKHAVNKYDDVLIMWLKTVMMVMWFWDYFSSVDRGVVELSGNDNSG